MKIKYLLLLLLLIPMVSAYQFEGVVPAGELYNLTELPSCVGTYQMKIRGVNEILENEYSFPKCTMGERFYECKCSDNANKVLLLTNKDTVNEYDIVVQYYISATKNPDTMRVVNINNIQVGPVEKKLSDMLPKINKVIIYIILIVIIFLLLIVFGVVMLWKTIMDSEEDAIDQFSPNKIEKTIEKNKKNINKEDIPNDNESDEDMDEELQNILDDL